MSVISSLDTAVDVQLKYESPQDLMAKTKLAPVVQGLSDKTIPVLYHGFHKSIDFRLLKGDVISDKHSLKLVDDMLNDIQGILKLSLPVLVAVTNIHTWQGK
jgi:hypothetical protein